MPNPNLVRVKLPTGREVTVGRSFAKSHKLELVDKPATAKSGGARRTKSRTSIADAVDSKKSKTREGSSSAASSEEETK